MQTSLVFSKASTVVLDQKEKSNHMNIQERYFNGDIKQDQGFKMPLINKFGLKRSDDKGEEFQLYEGSFKYKCLKGKDLFKNFESQRLNQQSESSRYEKTSSSPNYTIASRKASKSSNFHSNDTNILQQKLKTLEAELANLDQEYEQLTNENYQIKQENENIKAKNKQLFVQMIKNESASNYDGVGILQNEQTNIGEIHSLYQDLFLTDIKMQVETAQTELKQYKQEQNSVQREIAQLKKDNQQLTAMLKRYRKTLQELTNDKKDELNFTMMSPDDLQKMHIMSLDSIDPQVQQNMPQSNSRAQEQKSKVLKRSDSGTSSVQNLISQATFIETAKIERLLAALNSIQQAEKIYDILMTALREIKILVTCQNCTIFILDQELFGIEKTQNINMQKFTLDGGKYIDALCEDDKELSQPSFKKPEDIKYGLKTQQFLAQPVFFKDEETIMILQCEAKVNKKTNKFIGFYVADEQVLKIFSYYLQMRFERRVALKEVKNREKAVVDTLKLTSEICTQRHHDGLFKKMKENLPKFFGFEAVGVLIYNFNTNWLFTDPENIKKDELARKATIHLEEKTLDHVDNEVGNGQLSEEEKQEQLLNKIKELHQKKFMNFPCNSGISGHVFQNGQIYISNCATKETKFIDEIDNQSSCTDVKNFMIGPVYGEKKDIPCGIIQFINKEKGGAITQADETKFKVMQELIGLCIDNTNEMSLTINVSLDVHDVMKRISNIIKQEQQTLNEPQQDQNQMEILQNHIKSIKDTYNKLMDERNRAKSQI